MVKTWDADTDEARTDGTATAWLRLKCYAAFKLDTAVAFGTCRCSRKKAAHSYGQVTAEAASTPRLTW